MINKIFSKLFRDCSALNEKHIIELCQKYGKEGVWLDVGCDDGLWTRKVSGVKKVEWHAIEIARKRAILARNKNIKVHIGSIEKLFPYKDETFDLVHSNQVIEHLYNIDIFLAEIKRVLKPKGIFVISTENPASWHNIFALILGWQMFTTTNISIKKRSIGNPFSIHSENNFAFSDNLTNSAWEHNKVLTPRALTELLELYNFKILKKVGAGYYPLPAQLGKIDVNHSHFYVIVASKK